MELKELKSKLTEKDIEDFLWENPGVVSSPRFTVKKWTHRQLSLPSGRLDLMGITDRNNVVVVEVKNVPVNSSAITQVSRYSYDIRQILGIAEAKKHSSLSWDGTSDIYVVPVIVAPSFSDQIFRECKACYIETLVFAPVLNLNISSIAWTPDYLKQAGEQYEKIADSNKFSSLWEIATDGNQPHAEDDTPYIEGAYSLPSEDEDRLFKSDGCEWHESPDSKYLSDEYLDAINVMPGNDIECQIDEMFRQGGVS